MRHPGADGVVHRILEGATAALHGVDGGAEETHPLDVGGLAPYVLGAHVDLAAKAEAGAGGGGGHSMLAGTRLGDDARLPHP